MIIKIRPLDTFFFRDGKPFSRGQETWADGVFPPSPTILYGALRAIYFTHHPNEFEKANTSDDLTLKLKIKGVFLEIGEEIYLPVPADFVITEKDNTTQKRLLTVVENEDNHISSNKTSYITTIDIGETIKDMEKDALFNRRNYQRYLNIESLDKLRYRKDYLLNDPKIAFKKNDATMTVDEDSLHRVGTQRFKEDNGKVSIVIDFEDLNIPEQGLMKLGGEGKVAHYETISKKDYTRIDPPALTSTDKHFKICLATPALFKQGWLPSWINEKTLIGEFNQLKLKLLTAIIGKPVLVGGFDMKEGKPKPMYKAVPAGSVYYFELLEGRCMEEVIKVFHQHAISETFDTSNLINPNCTANQGFGITYVGKTPPPKECKCG